MLCDYGNSAFLKACQQQSPGGWIRAWGRRPAERQWNQEAQNQAEQPTPACSCHGRQANVHAPEATPVRDPAGR
jgi:hypothetical protein